jgi:hypothetical protein
MGRKVTLKNIQEVTVYRDGTSVDCYQTMQTHYSLRKYFQAKRKVDPKSKEVFYLVKIDCSVTSLNDNND